MPTLPAAVMRAFSVSTFVVTAVEKRRSPVARLALSSSALIEAKFRCVPPPPGILKKMLTRAPVPPDPGVRRVSLPVLAFDTSRLEEGLLVPMPTLPLLAKKRLEVAVIVLVFEKYGN